MDFDIQTSDFLIQMAEFIEGAGMKEELRKRAVVPIGKKLEELKAQLTKLLNRPLGHFAALHTTITSLKMEEAFVSDYGLEGRVALDGDAAVDLNL
jgi:tRNA A-37 threonylcarbamoyl transferase component Bud32